MTLLLNSYFYYYVVYALLSLYIICIIYLRRGLNISCNNSCLILLINLSQKNIITFRLYHSILTLVPLGTIGTIILQIKSERYILPMATYLQIVPMAYQWLAFWTTVVYMELHVLWMLISIIFHIADPCSFSYEQANYSIFEIF